MLREEAQLILSCEHYLLRIRKAIFHFSSMAPKPIPGGGIVPRTHIAPAILRVSSHHGRISL